MNRHAGSSWARWWVSRPVGSPGSAWLRVLVPPHNRIADAVVAGLHDAGYVGLSADKPRRRKMAGVVEVNTHIDIMDWVVTRAFLGDSACLAQALAHLAAKRTGDADPEEPTGLLTHHLAHDEAAWRFIDQFLSATRSHPAAQWRHPAELFRPRMATG